MIWQKETAKISLKMKNLQLPDADLLWHFSCGINK